MISAAAAPPANSVVPGVLGFLVVAGIALVCYFLFRSLNKQLHKVITGPVWRGSEKGGRRDRPPRGLRARGMLAVQDGESGPGSGPDGQRGGTSRP